jgi:hypothetical protein
MTNAQNVSTTSPSATLAAASFSPSCAALSPAYASCNAIKTNFIDGKSVPSVHFAYRAGAVCTTLQRCVNLPSTCPVPISVASVLNNKVNLTGPLDMCAREGLSSGAQLPNVLKATGVCLAVACVRPGPWQQLWASRRTMPKCCTSVIALRCKYRLIAPHNARHNRHVSELHMLPPLPAASPCCLLLLVLQMVCPPAGAWVMRTVLLANSAT